MKFSAALLVSAASLVAAGAYHGGKNETVEYTTEVVTQYTTYCPEPTTITDGTNTITVTEPTVITITNCPGGCTIEKPIYTTSAVVCNDCEAPTVPAGNATATYHPTGGVPEPTPAPEVPVEAGAAKIAGAGLAAFAGLVAFVL